MAFLIFRKITSGEILRFERVTPLRLSGADGLIARHVCRLPADETPGWKLDAADLLKLAGFEGERFAVLFDVTAGNPTNLCFYEVVRIHGSCRATSTTLALDFNVVLDRELDEFTPDSRLAFRAPQLAAPKKLAEILSLTGGPCGGDWKWGQPALQLGATLVQLPANRMPCMNTASSRKAAA